jgi:Carboxypeptidase regulatory-like domain
MNFRFTTILIVAVVGVTCSTEAAAQVAGGTIMGTVTDKTGAVVQNAHITIVNTATSITREVTANDDGAFSAPNLTPSTYLVRVEAKGFKTEVRENVRINVASVNALNFIMTVGAATEKIEVTTVNPPIELGSSAISGVVGGGRIRELPLNGRDWTQLATLEPGVSQIRTENELGNRVQQGAA